MQGIIARVLMVMLCGVLVMTGCSQQLRPSADHPDAGQPSALAQTLTPQAALVGTWINEAADQRTTITFFENGTLQRTYHSTTMLAGRPVTGRQDFLGTYRWVDAAHLRLEMKGTIYNSVEGTRQMEVQEQWTVALEGDNLSLQHQESDEASRFTRATQS